MFRCQGPQSQALAVLRRWWYSTGHTPATRPWSSCSVLQTHQIIDDQQPETISQCRRSFLGWREKWATNALYISYMVWLVKSTFLTATHPQQILTLRQYSTKPVKMDLKNTVKEAKINWQKVRNSNFDTILLFANLSHTRPFPAHSTFMDVLKPSRPSINGYVMPEYHIWSWSSGVVILVIVRSKRSQKILIARISSECTSERNINRKVQRG